MNPRNPLRAAAILTLFFVPFSAFAAPRVTLELLMETGVSPTASHEWIQALKSVGADDIRIRSIREGEEGGIKNFGTDASPNYTITGLIGLKDTLRLPAAAKPYSRRDAGAIAAYIRAIRQGGVKELTTPKGAFGLTAEELVDVHKKLSGPVAFDTKGRRTGDVMRQIVAALPLNVAVDESARAPFSGANVVAEDLATVSTGTAMAAAIRPLGLVFLPQKFGAEVRLVIIDSRKTTESWPVGWPPEESVGKAAPNLYEFISVEIDDFALDEALDAIQGRLEVPFLFDHNSLARHGVEMAEVRVSLPKGKTYYKKIVDRLLSQGKLKSEVRIDEAGEPFLWISTLKP